MERPVHVDVGLDLAVRFNMLGDAGRAPLRELVVPDVFRPAVRRFGALHACHKSNRGCHYPTYRAHLIFSSY
jgi:hypothetical protein